MVSADDRPWWKEGVVYQVYPKSFDDSNGDGIGDIRGIIERLDYLEDLGVDGVWLNPVYRSPQVDDGYDISDYRAIREEFGTMADLEELLDRLHDRDIRLIMDLVVNHTSDQHRWFRRSRSSRDDDYREYYVWVDGEPGDPPNDWESVFGGPAWTYDEPTGAYYLHLFHEAQPDLNWRNPDVREDIYEVMTGWLDRGVDGFRMDVINVLSKPRDFPDGGPGEDWVGSQHFLDGPRVHEYLREMHDRVLSQYDVVTVGETVAVDVEEARRYLRDGIDMVLPFDHVHLDYHDEAGWWEIGEWTLPELAEVFTRWQEGLAGEGWQGLYLGNHDQPRVVSRFGDEAYRRESATVLATLQFTLRGTPFVYQGEEIGMTNYPFADLAEFEDPQTVGRVEAARASGRIDGFEEVSELVRRRSRDNARTPMQWTAEHPHAGFTDGDPWLPVNPNARSVNVESARADPDSVWHYYRDLVALRADHDVLVYGTYDLLVGDHERIYAYTRTLGDERVLVVLNVSDAEARFECPPGVLADDRDAELLVGNYDDPPGSPSEAPLGPYEARVYLSGRPEGQSKPTSDRTPHAHQSP